MIESVPTLVPFFILGQGNLAHPKSLQLFNGSQSLPGLICLDKEMVLELAVLTLSSCSQQRSMQHEHCCKIPCSLKQGGLMSNEFSLNSNLQTDTLSKQQLSEKASSKQHHSSLCLGSLGGCCQSALGTGCCGLCQCLCASISSGCSGSLSEGFSLMQYSPPGRPGRWQSEPIYPFLQIQ